MRRRDLVRHVEPRRSRRVRTLVVVVVVILGVIFLWLALQTLGGQSSKGGAGIQDRLR